MSRVILSGYMMVEPDSLASVLAELPHHISHTREEPGCVAFSVSKHRKEPNRLDVYEEFISREAFLAHQKRTRESKWGALTAKCKRYYKTDGME